MLHIDLKPAIEKAKSNHSKLIGLQVPEGLKTKVKKYMDLISKETDAEVIVFADPCYGACDVADSKAKRLGCDFLIHIGHSKMLETKTPTTYVYGKYDVDINIILKKLETLLKDKGIKRISLVTTVQYLDYLEPIKAKLEKKGITVMIGKESGRTKFPGQVLGCDFSAVRNTPDIAEAVVYFGDGIFHPLGIALTFNIPTIIADPLSGEVRGLDKEKDLYLKKRWGQIALAKEAQVFGILISTKMGQIRMELAKNIAKLLRKSGRVAYLIAMDHIGTYQLEGMGLEALVSVACPRIAIDDADMYKQPILTPTELEIVLGKRKDDKYVFDEL